MHTKQTGNPSRHPGSYRSFRWYLILLCVVMSGLSVLAQSVTARFSGRVVDTDGAVIPGASVQIVNQETLAHREVLTDGLGAYVLPSLAPGRYQIIVSADGFDRKESNIITIVAGQEFVFNVNMSVSGLQTEVQVSAGAGVTTVETNTASISTTLGEREVSGYALNGRNFSQLITMAPGVSNQSGQDEAKVGVAGSAKFSVNGGRVEYNTFQVDGSDVLNTSINASRGQGQPLIVYPSIDAIQELKVLTADYSALYGKSASGSVLVTTKSGTDKFHGNVYAFVRNEMFNARNYFDQPDPVSLGYTGRLRYRTPLYRRLDFGGTLGGPIYIPGLYNNKKNKTFFFFSEEIRREKTPVDYNQAVPTVAERAGDFSDVCPLNTPGSSPYFNPASAPDCPVGTFDAPGHAQIGRKVSINYTSAAILNSGLIPLPNSSTGCNSTINSALPHCYVAAVSPPTHWREELFRIDHNLTENQRLSFRYIHDSWDTVTLAPQWGVVQNSFPTVQNRLNGPGLNMMVSLSQTFPHGFANLLSASYEVEHISLTPQPGQGVNSLDRPAVLDNPSVTGGTPVAGSKYCSQFSAPGSAYTPSTLIECPMGRIFDNGFGGNKLPGLVFQGNNGVYGGHGFAADTGYAPWTQSNPTFDVRDDLSKVLGKHSLQVGFEGTYVQQNEQSAVSGANSGDQQGLLTFSNQQSIYTTGNAFADFLAGPGFTQGQIPSFGFVSSGAIKSFTQDSGQRRYYSRYKIAEFYVQDDWRATPRLTINVGFRGSFFGAWYNPNNTAYSWRPEAFSSSLAASIFVDPINGYLTRSSGGQPVPLNMNSLDPVITNGLVQCGVNNVPNSCMTNTLFHPAPRVGFSWDPWGNGKTAIRAGYGLFWEHGTGYEANIGSLIGSAPLVLSETQSNIFNSSGSQYSQIGFSCQGGAAQCVSPASSGGATFPLNVTSIPTKAIYPYIQQWSFSIQREVHKAMVAQLAYVGTKATHLTAVRDLNQRAAALGAGNPFGSNEPITASVCQSGANNGGFFTSGLNDGGSGAISVPSSPSISPGSPGYVNMFIACAGNPGFIYLNQPPYRKLGVSADAVRPYPGFSNIISVENIADSSYHALQATLRQTTGPLTVGVAYTYSHSLDNSSDRSSANFADSLDIRGNRASSDFDQRHLLNINYIYDLPFLKLLAGFAHLVGSGGDPSDDNYSMKDDTRFWQPGSFLKTALGGWQLSGITTYQTGTPFSVINGGGSNGTGSADNAGVGNGLGIGSYADVVSSAYVGKPFVQPGGNNIGPLLLNPGAYVAPRGLTFGNSGRNSLHNPSRINFNMSMYKHFKPWKELLDIEFRVEAYNVFNHTQFRITDSSHPGNTGNNVINCYGSQAEFYSAGAQGCLAGNSFLHPVDAHDPRILQFGLKGSF
jgi:hypothetical protein